jgi:drug/metabolite transporter (DMT)-like permease
MGTFLARFRVDLLLLLVAVSWGSTYLVAKQLVTAGTVMALLAVRMLLAAGVMAAIAGVRRKRLTRKEVRAGIPIGMLLTAVFAFETFGLAHTSATNAGLIISLTMVFTPVLESVVLRRRLPAAFFTAAIIAVVGVVLLAGNGTFDPPNLGDLLVLGAAVMRAAHVVSMHKLTGGKAIDSLHLTTVQLGTCALLFTTGSFIYGDPITHYLSRLDPRQGVMFLYLVLICTVFAFFVQIWAVRRTSPSRVSLLLGTEPVWAAVIGITIAHDSIGPAGYCGIALILTGTAWGRVTEQRHRQAVSKFHPLRSEPKGNTLPGQTELTVPIPPILACPRKTRRSSTCPGKGSHTGR